MTAFVGRVVRWPLAWVEYRRARAAFAAASGPGNAHKVRILCGVEEEGGRCKVAAPGGGLCPQHAQAKKEDTDD